MTALEAAASTIAAGGGTFAADTLEPMALESGYAVALAPGTAALAHGNDAGEIADAIERVRRAYPRAPYIGTWRADDGAVHIDPVAIIPDRASAGIIGRVFAQIAVYDLGAGLEVTL